MHAYLLTCSVHHPLAHVLSIPHFLGFRQVFINLFTCSRGAGAECPTDNWQPTTDNCPLATDNCPLPLHARFRILTTPNSRFVSRSGKLEREGAPASSRTM